MSKYALSILLCFIFISLHAQISQYQFSVQAKPYVALEGGTNLTADFTEEDWEDYNLILQLPEEINFEFDQKVICPYLEITFDGVVYAYCFDENFESNYEVLFAPQATIMDYIYNEGMDSLNSEIWYQFKDGISYLEFRKFSFYYFSFLDISPGALFNFTISIDHESGSFLYHFGPSEYNPAVNELLYDAEYSIGAAYFKEIEDVNSDFAGIILSGDPASPDVNIFEYGNEPSEDYIMNAIPAEGTLYKFTLNPNSTNNLDTKLTEYSVVPNPGNNEAIINNDVQSITAELSIWNINGQLMNQSIINDKANIDTSTFPAGLYFFQVTTEQGTQTIKWMKR